MSKKGKRLWEQDSTVPLMVVVVCSYCWEGDPTLVHTDEKTDFLALIHVKLSCSWYELTCLINDAFEQNSVVKLNEEKVSCSDSITSYEYNSVLWTMDDYPTASLYSMLTQDGTSHITIRLKGMVESCLDDLSYSSMITTQALEECIRIIYQEKKLMLTVNEESEANYFVTCFSQWIQMKQEQENIPCTIIKVNRNENRTIASLTNTLINHGILQNREQNNLNEKFIVILNIDFMEKEGFTSTIFDWLLYSPAKTGLNGYHGDDESYYLNKDVVVIAHVTNDRVNTLTQSSYRLFKIISLPSLLPGIVYRWLREKITNYSAQIADEMEMFETVTWLSNVYHSLHKSFFKIELAHKLPDISVYLDAPIADRTELFDWIKQLWTESIIPCVEDSVRQRTGAAAGAQQQLLITATLKALFEKAIRPGCPIDLNL